MIMIFDIPIHTGLMGVVVAFYVVGRISSIAVTNTLMDFLWRHAPVAFFVAYIMFPGVLMLVAKLLSLDTNSPRYFIRNQ